MARSKSKDDNVFTSQQTHELNYFAHLYDNNEDVQAFLRRQCAIGSIDNKTHYEVFQFIEKELGFPIP